MSEPRVDCEMVTKYSPIFFTNFDEYFVYAIIAISHDFSIPIHKRLPGPSVKVKILGLCPQFLTSLTNVKECKNMFEPYIEIGNIFFLFHSNISCGFSLEVSE